MSEYWQTVQKIAERCAAEGARTIMERLHTGKLLADLDEDASFDDTLEQWMIRSWTSLTDSSNEYWQLDNVTPEDKMLVYRKLKKDVEPLFVEQILHQLREAAMGMQHDCLGLYARYRDKWREATITGSSLLSDLHKMQTELHAIADKARTLQSLIMYLAGKGVAIKPETWSESDLAIPSRDEQGAAETQTLHKFERKLRGGVVTTIRPQGTFVPESEIRKQGIEHGDLLRLTKTYRHDGQTRFEFELAEKQPEPQPERIQLDRCRIKKDGTMLYTDSCMQTDGETTIRIGETPHRIMIKDEDVKMFRLEEGDRVDIAYWANHPTGAKVIWKHIDDNRANIA